MSLENVRSGLVVHRRAATALGVAAVIASVAGVVAAAGGQDTSYDRKAGAGAPRTDRPVASVHDHFSVLSANADAGRLSTDDTAAAYGGNGALSRRALVKSDGNSVYLTPTAGGLCLGTKRSGNFTCGSADAAVAGKIGGAIICGSGPTDMIQIYGAMPDGVAEVHIRRAEGRRWQCQSRATPTPLTPPRPIRCQR